MAMQSGVSRAAQWIQVQVLSVDGTSAITRDQTGITRTLRRDQVRAKGSWPQVGEVWICDRTIANQWTFALALNSIDYVADLQQQLGSLKTELFGSTTRTYAPRCTAKLNTAVSISSSSLYTATSSWSAATDPDAMFKVSGTRSYIPITIPGRYVVWVNAIFDTASISSGARVGTYVIKGLNDSTSLARDMRLLPNGRTFTRCLGEVWLNAGDQVSSAMWHDSSSGTVSLNPTNLGVNTEMGVRFVSSTA